MIGKHVLIGLLGVCGGMLLVPRSSDAQDSEWRVVKPSNTGIPGEEVRFVRFAPDGKLWVGARWPFWQEGGVGIYDFASQTWTTLANWETPIPSEHVNDMAFGPGGVVWMATDGGLVKKDGETWTVYDAANSPLLHNVIRGIELDSEGHVWINNTNVQNQNAALFKFDGATWRRFAVPTELPWADPWRQLSGLLVDSNDHVWVANETLNGVAEYDGKTWTLHGAGVGRFGKIMEDLQGNIWLIAGVGGGNAFWKFDHTSFTLYGPANTPFVDTTITTMGLDDDGTVYVGNWAGQVIKTTDAGLSWTLYLSGLNHVFNITPDPESDDVWIGTPGAVGHFRGDASWVRDYNSYNTGMPWYWIDRMTLDPLGNLWFATGEAGLSRFDGQRWRNWGAHNAGSEPYPFAGNEPMGCFYLDGSGVGWMGGNGIARWDPATGQFTGFWNWQNNPGMGVSLWIYFAEDAAGNLFAAEKYGAIYRFNGSMWVQEPVQPYAPLGLPGMQADAGGNIWVAAWFDLHKWDGTSWSVATLPYPNYFYDLGGINCMAIGPGDVKWFGTDEGLVRWDGATFTLYDTANSPLPAKEVQGIDVRADGLVGLSAIEFGSVTPFPNGVAVIDGDIDDPGNWSVYHYEDSPLPHYQLGAVAFDAQGNLWVSALSEGVAILMNGAAGHPGDFDGDGDVDLDDFGVFAACYNGANNPPAPGCPPGVDADLDGDGDVDLDDFSIFAANYTGSL